MILLKKTEYFLSNISLSEFLHRANDSVRVLSVKLLNFLLWNLSLIFSEVLITNALSYIQTFVAVIICANCSLSLQGKHSYKEHARRFFLL